MQPLLYFVAPLINKILQSKRPLSTNFNGTGARPPSPDRRSEALKWPIITILIIHLV